jgi:carbon storage regulator
VLVLSRRVGESVMIGDDVVVSLLEVRGDLVRIGIDAPRHVRVYREEVYREVQKANLAAAAASDTDVHALTSMLGRRGKPAERPKRGGGQDGKHGGGPAGRLSE